MERFVTNNQGRITFVSKKKFEGCITVPKDITATDKELIAGYRIVDGHLVNRNLSKEISELKIAFVGVWKIPCGIATYTEYLLPEMVKHIKDYKIFCEVGVEPSEKVIPCFKRGESLMDLAKQIKNYKPDVILIQHEYGIFPDARKWLSFLTQVQDIKTVVALHSIYAHEDKTICEAPIKNIIVHTDLARQVLSDKKKVAGSVEVIPHGCLLPEMKPRLWNLYQSPHTFMQFGFGFEYKGWENALHACKILKEKYPEVFFTGIFSESPHNKMTHDFYFDKLMKLVDDLGIQENVSFLRGFQSDEVLDSFFRVNKCAVFPYKNNGEHTVYGVTGAARIAMKSGIPVITSDVPFFYDLKGTCPQANNPTELAGEIEKAWKDPKTHVEKQNKFLIDTSWEKVAIKYLDFLVR